MEPGHGVKAKSGRHKGKTGHVVHDLGHQRVLHVYFPGYGMSFQPSTNLDPDHDGDTDTPAGGDTDHDPVTAADEVLWDAEEWEAAMAQLLEHDRSEP